MSWTEHDLTEQQRISLEEISRQTGKSVEKLICQAVEQFIGELQQPPAERVALMQKGRGIWEDRQDLPDFEDLRREWDRFSHSN